jgi:hypothetical protein
MKKIIIILACVSASCLMHSCGTLKGTVTAVTPEKDVLITPELRDFLKKKPNPVIMLRVPTSVSTVTGADTREVKDYNSLYGAIEKVLMKSGFTIRDRGLLNSLLGSGQTDYKAIGEKTKTDLIIEITSLAVNNAAKTVDWTATKGLRKKDLMKLEPKVNANEYVIEAKVVIVEEGLTGGMLTFYYCTCARTGYPCSFQIHAYDAIANPKFRFHERAEWGTCLTWYATEEEVAQSFGRDLIYLLRGMAD